MRHQKSRSAFTPLEIFQSRSKTAISRKFRNAKNSQSRFLSLTGFTLVEILIVVAIIAILALAIIPNYVGFDVDARIVTTKSNLSTIRNRIALYRAKEGKYPESLNNLLTETYSDAGIEKPYLKAVPGELVSDKSGNSTFQDQPSTKAFSNLGGWIYLTDKADVVVNSNKPLDKAWEDYKGQVPSEW